MKLLTVVCVMLCVRSGLSIVGECGVFNDTLSHPQEFIVDGTFEASEPYTLYKGLDSSDPIKTVGAICGPNVQSAADLILSAEEFTNDLEAQCDQYDQDGGYLGLYEEAGQVLVNEVFANGFKRVSLVLRDYVPDGAFSHVRFWYAERHLNESVNESTLAETQMILGLFLNSGPIILSVETVEPIDIADCPELGFWRRYDLPLGGAEDLLRNSSADFQNLLLFMGTSEDRVFAINNIELINLNNASERVDPGDGINRLDKFGLLEETSCPSEVIDSFSIIAISVISACLMGFCLSVVVHSIVGTVIMDALWFIASLVLSLLAVVEVQEFEQKLGNLDACTDAINEGFVEATKIVYPPELRESFDISESALFGIFQFVLPPYSASDITKLFATEAVTGSEVNGCTGSNCIQCNIPTSGDNIFEEFCNQTASAVTCVSNMAAFLNNSDPVVDFGGRVGVYEIEGEISSSQAHWTELIFIAFIVDVVLSLLHVVFRVIIRLTFHKEKTRARFVSMLNIVSVLISAGFTGYILWLTFFDPIRYETVFFLKRGFGAFSGGAFPQNLGIFVCPQLLVTNDKTNVQIDLSAVSTITRNYSSADEMFSAYVDQTNREILEISPNGRATSDTACPLEGMQRTFLQTNSSEEFFFELPCNGNTKVELLPQEAAAERQNFLLVNVVIGLVLVDFMITFVDAFTLGLLFCHLRRINGSNNDGSKQFTSAWFA